jgi:hypothetical protein
MKSLGEDICKLLRGIHSNQTQVSILDRFMGEVLSDVDVLGTLSASDNVPSPQQPPWMLSSTPPLLLTEQSSSAASIDRRSASDCRGTSCLS